MEILVEDTEMTLEDIQKEFGNTAAKIIDGLTKISRLHQTASIQAENYRKILLTLSDDIRVILIKIADRLHNMRTLDGQNRKNQFKDFIGKQFIYMHHFRNRLGLYSIKGELEDLAMKYTETEKYKEIAKALESTKKDRTKYINDFVKPLQEEMDKSGLKASVFGRQIHLIYLE